MSFADIESRMNASVYKSLKNASATYTPGIGSPTTFPIVFDAAGGFVDGLGVSTQQPYFSMEPAAFSTLEEGMALTIAKNDKLATPVGSFKVRSVVPLDEGGWQRVMLTRG